MTIISGKGENKKEYILTDEVPFELLSLAYSNALEGNGFSNADGGRIIFDGLYTNNEEDLDVLQEPKNVKKYFGLCCKAFSLVDFDVAEIKKNA